MGGKSTFLKLLSGELETSKGNVYYPSDKRLSLRQDHHAYDEDFVIDLSLKVIQSMKQKLNVKPSI